MAKISSRLLFCCPNAPTSCQISPSGFEWFDLMQTSQEKIIEEFQSSLKLLDQFINTQLKEQGLEKKDLYLMGFSQGTMMSLQLALSYKNPIAGVLGYSGKVYDFNFLEKNIFPNVLFFYYMEPQILLFHWKKCMRVMNF